MGTVLGYWLERYQGVAMLHGAGVVVGDHAVGFLATNYGGKSSLAASLMQLGHPLLTDDNLPLERCNGSFMARPGYPQMRMWPDQVRHFVGDTGGLERVHPDFDKRRLGVGPEGFGSFCSKTRPLSCLYLPERFDSPQDGPITIERLKLHEAVIELIHNSFLFGIVEAAGLQGQRFEFLANLAKQVPVKKLRYPSGVERLPRIAEAIVADVRREIR